MKILIVTAEPECAPLNGVGKFVWEFSQALKTVAEVKVLSLQLDPFFQPVKTEKGFLEESNNIYKADYIFKSEYDCYTENVEARYMFASHRAMPYIKSVLAEFLPDIIYVQGPKPWFPFRYEKNTVIALHGLVKDIVGKKVPNPMWIAQQKCELEAASRSSALILFSSFMKSRWQSLYDSNIIPNLLPLGIDANIYERTKNPKTFQVAFFGRLDDAQKKYTIFLEATKNLPSETGDGRLVSFHVWGQGETIDPVLYPQVTFHGHVSNDELLTAFAKTNVVVMPSAYEPFGFVALEALASGCILLVPKGQGMDEFIKPDENCIEITSDVFSVHNQLKKVLESPNKYMALVNAGLDTASHWSWHRSVQEHYSFFQKIMSESNSLIT